MTTLTVIMTNAERVAVRARIRRNCLAEAEDLALRRGRTMKCGGWLTLGWAPTHAGRPGGCTDDGTRCICGCHDAEESA